MKKIINKLLILMFFGLSISPLESKVQVVVKNKTGKSINFQVCLRGERDPEKEDIKNNKYKQIFKARRFRIHGCKTSIRKWGRDPRAKLDGVNYYIDERFVRKVRFTVHKSGNHIKTRIRVYLKNGKSYESRRYSTKLR